MRITDKGQVTIPVDVRKKMGLLPHTEVGFVVDGDVVYLRKATSGESRGEKVVEKMRGRATVQVSTDEIMALTRGED